MALVIYKIPGICFQASEELSEETEDREE